MNTFNNLEVTNAKRMTKEAGKLGLVYPVMNRKDAERCAAIRAAVRSAVQSAERHLANSCHAVKSKGEYVTKDRLGSLMNAIDKFSKLNAGVLSKPELKNQWIELAWLAYAKLETQGTDNAHFMQADLPADGRRDAEYQTVKRTMRTMPDSKYPGSEWMLLEAADMFEAKRRDIQPEPLGLDEHSECRTAVMPIPATVPEWFGGYTPEQVEAGQGSGLPFEPQAEPMPAPEAPKAKKPDPERFDQSFSEWNRRGARVWPINS